MLESCPICGGAVRSGARFCPACGNALPADVSDSPLAQQLFCVQCGTSILQDARFCRSCGRETEEAAAPLPTDDSSATGAEKPSGEIVLASFKFASCGTVVLCHRPLSKQPRRSDARADEYGSLSQVDYDSLAALLDESLIWDGYLFATIIGAPTGESLNCVWHVLNGDLYPLEAEHAQSVMLYVDDLKPRGWSIDDLDLIGDAPHLGFWNET
jgi:RNA polymerase subunit RPABC4/transcription elongation factor Spt4